MKLKTIGLKDLQNAWPAIEESLGDTIFSQKFQTASDKERQLMIAIAESGKICLSSGFQKLWKRSGAIFKT